jgi:hypothetical protein
MIFFDGRWAEDWPRSSRFIRLGVFLRLTAANVGQPPRHCHCKLGAMIFEVWVAAMVLENETSGACGDAFPMICRKSRSKLQGDPPKELVSRFLLAYH